MAALITGMMKTEIGCTIGEMENIALVYGNPSFNRAVESSTSHLMSPVSHLIAYFPRGDPGKSSLI